MFSPIGWDSPQRQLWDLVTVTVSLVAAWHAPAWSSFAGTAPSPMWVDVDTLCAAVFAVDACLSLVTTYVDGQTRDEVRDVWRIANHRLRSWHRLPLDVLASIPMAGTLRAGRRSLALGVLVGARLCRASKGLTQTAVMWEKMIASTLYGGAVVWAVRSVCIVGAFVVVNHWTACGYYFVCSSAASDDDGGYCMTRQERDEWTFAQKYWRSMLVMMSGLVEGTPKRDMEMLYACFAVTVSVSASGMLIAAFAEFVREFQARAASHILSLRSVDQYMRMNSVPPKLRKHVIEHINFSHLCGHDMTTGGLLEALPDKLQLELNVTLKSRLIQRIEFFSSLSPHALSYLICHLGSLLCSPGDLIVKAGEHADRMYIVSKGFFDVILPNHHGRGARRRSSAKSVSARNGRLGRRFSDGEASLAAEETDVYVGTLGPGMHFGEIALLHSDRSRTASIRSATFGELFFLNAHDFRTLMHDQSDVRELVGALAKEREKLSSKVEDRDKRPHRPFVSPGAVLRRRDSAGMRTAPERYGLGKCAKPLDTSLWEEFQHTSVAQAQELMAQSEAALGRASGPPGRAGGPGGTPAGARGQAERRSESPGVPDAANMVRPRGGGED